MYCTRCGAAVGIGETYCTGCGNRVRSTQRTSPDKPFGWLEATFVVGLALIVIASVSPYLGGSPYVLGAWSGTPAIMPLGISVTAGKFVRLDITDVDSAGNVAGSMKVVGISGPIAGKVHGRHLSLIVTSSEPAGPVYYGIAFEGTIRGDTIDGTLMESGSSQWNTRPLNYEVSLRRF
jgi:hypothetical protein